MEAVHVATLRGICARYIEGHVGPVLQELLRSQQLVETQLESLTQTAVRKSDHSATEARLADLVATCATDLAELATKVEHLESTGADGGASASLEELRQALEKEFALKADLSELPSMEQFRDLSEELDRKANINQVPASAQLQRIAEKVERKANTSKVPTLTQFQELSALVESKANIQSVPTVSQFEDFCGTVERKISACSLVNPGQIQKLSAALERKADLDQVPTCLRVEELGNLLKKRAVAAEVPTLIQFKDLAIRVERSEKDLMKQANAAASDPCVSCVGNGALPPASPGNAMGTNGMHSQANVVWLVPAAMGHEGQWGDNGYAQHGGCNGMWAPQGGDCQQQWRPQNGINGGTQHQHQQQ